MKYTTARMGSFLLATTLLLGACGSSSSDAGDGGLASSAEETTTSAAEETATTVEETTTTAAAEETTTAPESSDEGSGLLQGITDEERALLLQELGMTEAEFDQFETLINTEAGQDLMAQGIVDSSDLTLEQAQCVIGNGDILGLMMMGMAGDAAEPDSELMSSFFQTLETCGIPLTAFGG